MHWVILLRTVQWSVCFVSVLHASTGESVSYRNKMLAFPRFGGFFLMPLCTYSSCTYTCLCKSQAESGIVCMLQSSAHLLGLEMKCGEFPPKNGCISGEQPVLCTVDRLSSILTCMCLEPRLLRAPWQ